MAARLQIGCGRGTRLDVCRVLWRVNRVRLSTDVHCSVRPGVQLRVRLPPCVSKARRRVRRRSDLHWLSKTHLGWTSDSSPPCSQLIKAGAKVDLGIGSHDGQTIACAESPWGRVTYRTAVGMHVEFQKSFWTAIIIGVAMVVDFRSGSSTEGVKRTGLHCPSMFKTPL